MTNQIKHILHKAIWAPSAGNFQPWLFQIHDTCSFTVLFSKDEKSMLDICGHKTFTDIGCLLETIDIVCKNDFAIVPTFHKIQQTDDNYSIRVNLSHATHPQKDPLSDHILTRCTNRQSFLKTPLSSSTKEDLEKELATFNCRIKWIEGDRDKLSKLWRCASKVRFLMPHGIEFFKDMMEWSDTSKQGGSIDKIPMESSGISSGGRKLLKVLVKHPQLMRKVFMFNVDILMNKEANVEPCNNCGALFGIYLEEEITDPQEEESVENLVRIGRSFMRFWLKATSYGLQIHPESVITILARLLKRNMLEVPEDCKIHCENLVELCDDIFGNGVALIGRIGYGESVNSLPRSLRKPLESFIIEK